MKFTNSQDSKLLYWYADINSPSRTQIIDTQKETSHMHRDLSREKQLLKTPSYLYCINEIREMNTYALSSLSTTYKCIVYPFAWLTNSSGHLANFQALQAPISLCCLLRKLVSTI